ncbi:LOG family protein [Thioclava nitratireducens]|uniref:AMP nucleosidase n=1 Tax=Thioclava nitratireducens TaxID=1915078 RepID=A0ABM6IH46_9RHOB|nr:LOG family protein [Thioclava nitratireducens]AQS48033.1 cytochrome D ubiquinol oxidase subunit II [Thioclava nitratireducens]WGT50464.1 LOG family protein [Thioclava nitratireducens]
MSETIEGERAKPQPADDVAREVDLPWCEPKPSHEDVRAPDLTREIMAHPNYLQADEDVDFLNRDDMRGARLQLDYQKAETLLREQGIAHSIVVFGGTRIPEPQAAHEKLAEMEARSAADPGNDDLTRRVEIARRVAAKSRYYDVARAFGRIVGAREGPHGNRLVIVTGGGPGMMEAANRGAYDAGARTVGLNITLPHEQFPNPYITPGLCFRFRYFALRKLHFLMRARALVVFPGGYGTLDELFETLTLIQTRKIRPLPVILVGREYWSRVFDPDFLVEEGVIDPEDRDLFWYAESAEEIWEDIGRWYAQFGRNIDEPMGGEDEDFISRCRA